MKLSEWLTKNGLTDNAFAIRIGVKQQTISRYSAGERLPRRHIMNRIYQETGGNVTPNDFFAQHQERAQ